MTLGEDHLYHTIAISQSQTISNYLKFLLFRFLFGPYNVPIIYEINSFFNSLSQTETETRPHFISLACVTREELSASRKVVPPAHHH